MKAPPVGIDLGTSTSEIAVFEDGRPRVVPDPDSPTRGSIVPSVVAVDRSGHLLVGLQALAYVDLPGHGVRQVKRLMGTSQRVMLGPHSLRPQEVSALVLRQLKSSAERLVGAEVRQIVLSVPANFPDAARQATRDAAELAGLEVVRLINEPTAAALAFGVRHTEAEGQVVVFDFGGGTLDITVLEMMEGVLDVKASYGDPELGGKDLDEALMDHLATRFLAVHPGALTSDRSVADLRTVAEAAKVQLTHHASIVVRCPNYGILNGMPVDLEMEVTRAEFEQAVAPLLDRARRCLLQALEVCKIRPSAVDHVLLVGGTTYVPAVRQLVASLFGKEPRADVDPDLAVAQGAATEAALIAGVVPPESGPILTDVCPYGLGVHVVGVVGRHLMDNLYDPLIAPNATIPFSVKRMYSLVHAQQKTVEVSLYQDHEGRARTIEEALPTGLLARIEDVPVSATGEPHPIEVEFSYDLNGLVHLDASIPATGQRARVTSFSDPARRIDSSQRQSSRERVDHLWSRSSLAQRFEPVLKRAERLLPLLNPDDRRRMHEVGARLYQALQEGNALAAEEAGRAMTDLLFELED